MIKLLMSFEKDVSLIWTSSKCGGVWLMLCYLSLKRENVILELVIVCSLAMLIIMGPAPLPFTFLPFSPILISMTDTWQISNLRVETKPRKRQYFSHSFTFIFFPLSLSLLLCSSPSLSLFSKITSPPPSPGHQKRRHQILPE
jgi:hypothetical protein